MKLKTLLLFYNTSLEANFEEKSHLKIELLSVYAKLN